MSTTYYLSSHITHQYVQSPFNTTIAALMGGDANFQAHAEEPGVVASHFGSDLDNGLSAGQIDALREKYGPNELEQEEATPIWKLILEQFDDLLVKILLASAVFSFLIAVVQGNEEEGMSAYVEPFVILLILVINAAVGVWQESNAENALEALKQLQPKNAACIRDGELIPELDASELVPGDLVRVNIGDKVPADIRLTKLLTTTLRVDEASLTGESATVLKQVEPLGRSTQYRVSQKVNMVFSGTTVSGGRALGIVVDTGMRTEIGKVQEAVTDSEDDKTPLKIKLDEFGNQLTKVIGVICLLVWVMNYSQFFDPIHGSVFNGCIYYLKIAVALGVAAIPEGLPAVITLCLALGTRRMVKKNAIVRKLPSVETLGCTTVICSDKTGTLTLNEMTVVSIVTIGKNDTDLIESSVTGRSYNPAGEVEGVSMTSKTVGLQDFASVCTVCNDAVINWSEADGKFIRVGEPTEAALKVVGEKLGFPNRGPISSDKSLSTHEATDYFTKQYPRVATLEFSRGRKSMSVLCKGKKGNVLLCKGAPEGLLDRCNRLRLADGSTVTLSAKGKAAIKAQISDMAERPLRVLGLAIKDDLDAELAGYDGSKSHKATARLAVDPDKFASIEQDMVFIGLAGIKDPARPEVAPSIELCKDAGIRVIMITGDNQETAEAIAREIGIFGKDEDVTGKSFTGKGFMALSQDKKIEALMAGGGGRVFSRTDPTDKQALVKLLKSQGEVPAMTGDGVNDAPALKAASIGIAMGIAGTEVAKEASDMVLADDNFATIVSAVEEGRAIYSNMKAFIRYLISSNIGEVASIFFTAALGLPEGMVPVQLLWVNLVTDGPPATALGFNPADADIMKKPPRRADDQLITGWVFFRYMVIGVYVGFATVGIFVYWYMFYDWAGDGHTLVTWDQLSHWGQCTNWQNFSVNDFGGMTFSDPCTYFTKGKVKASTLSLSVLVTIEMLNALNALSEDGSLLSVPPPLPPLMLRLFVFLVKIVSLFLNFLFVDL